MNPPQTGSDADPGAPLFSESVAERGPGAPRLVMAHGFTQNTRCWGEFPGLLSKRQPEHSVTLVDMPGHGKSGHDEADLPAAGALLAAKGPGIFIGYSMGGRIALHAALGHPGAVQALVLIGATAGIEDATERTVRRQRDHDLAANIEATQAETDSTTPFIDRWLATPLFAQLTPEQQHREARISNRAEGLAASLRNCGTGSQKPLHERLGQLSMSVLCIAGETDAKFRAESDMLARAIGPNATTAIIPDAGHACHLEAPEATAQVIAEWLRTRPVRA